VISGCSTEVLSVLALTERAHYMQKKRRLDEVCCELAPEYSRKLIQSFILAGKVFVNDEKVTKAGHQVGSPVAAPQLGGPKRLLHARNHASLLLHSSLHIWALTYVHSVGECQELVCTGARKTLFARE
jgi:hypothetical protein